MTAVESNQGSRLSSRRKEYQMEPIQGNVLGQRPRSAVRTSFVLPEGMLCDPPLLVQKHLGESNGQEDSSQTPFWLSSSPVSNLNPQLETLRTAWLDMTRLLANRPVVEVPEVFEMPAVATRRVWAKVRYVGPAPFVFVDELADDATDTHD